MGSGFRLKFQGEIQYFSLWTSCIYSRFRGFESIFSWTRGIVMLWYMLCSGMCFAETIEYLCLHLNSYCSLLHLYCLYLPFATQWHDEE